MSKLRRADDMTIHACKPRSSPPLTPLDKTSSSVVVANDHPRFSDPTKIRIGEKHQGAS
ncbi:hypothetical protein CBOM_04654 [Ceraceosorus bombacis]|uniref:Uncharacterized protein n=1 Tax=Ceraceosorus bombacis TaxID=401625 RepID=A0A0P1BPA0_9BASI|nr:hypothetical protein CBOM_04654 [Ceraceosorus bombacis]